MSPDRDPVRLDPGNHDDPEAGRCLAEHVAVRHRLVALLDSALDEVLDEGLEHARPAASPVTSRRGSSAALRAATREELCA